MMPISLAICALRPLDEFSEKQKRFSKILQIGPFICQPAIFSQNSFISDILTRQKAQGQGEVQIVVTHHKAELVVCDK